jgi:hypothetical protein
METEKNTLEYLYSLKPAHRFDGQSELSLYDAIRRTEFCGDWAEAGVFEGRDARYMSKLLPENTHLYLFDSFEGLQQDWIVNGKVFFIDNQPVISESGTWDKFEKGCFKTEVPKFDDSNIHVIVGDVYDTCYEFGAKHRPRLSFIHMDLDLFYPTKVALRGLEPLMKTGTIILFDEYYNYGGDGWLKHEYKAFQEFITISGYNFEYLFREDKFRVCVRMIVK